tara:strand:- start:789 stop:1403 length:615 start_codon:yes stop_codon:yes gene_type:complete
MAETEMLDTELMETVSPFNRAIPGQSLTNSPDNPYPWEKPPQFTTVPQALDHIVESILTDDERLGAVIEILGSGKLAIAEIAQIILETGFRKGQWNPDLLLLLAEPVMVVLMALSEKVGFGDYEIYEGEKDELEEEERIELANEIINSLKEEVNFKGLKKQGNIDIRSVPKEILETIEEAPIEQPQSLLAAPTEEKQPSLLGEV